MFFYIFKKVDWVLIVSIFLLCLIGLFSIYSTSFEKKEVFFYKQILFIGLGFLIMIILTTIDYRFFRNHPSLLIIFYFIGALLLLFVLIFGKEVRGAASWFRLGIFSFEPVEVIKIIMLLIMAQYFSIRHIELYRIRHIIISGLYTFIPIMLVFLQPDFGSASILVFLWIGIMIVAGIKIRQLLILFLIGIIILSIAWFFILKPYQKERVVSFLNPYIDPLGSGYHRIQSVIAIGAGGLWGRGVGHGSQSQLSFLPEQHTDFIFSSIAEEFGFLIVFLIFILYAIIFLRIIKISMISNNNFARLFCVGALIIFLFQTLVNVGMNLGIMPIAGISLPFISYGGSNLIVNFAIIGIIQSIIVRRT
ncbi:MAG: rod shape-determining protein RodA [Candidatus Portnoybacteria bacterium]|nr:rod shape-determining protein RodA [Candidatus Portnoybacteria bacterium]